MLIIALGLAVIGLAALVFAVVTGNELIAWVCIGASVLGVVLLIIDALQERQRRGAGGADKEPAAADGESRDDSDDGEDAYADYPEDEPDEGHDAAAPADSESNADADAAGETVSDERNSR
jgi:hypothetical protein